MTRRDRNGIILAGTLASLALAGGCRSGVSLDGGARLGPSDFRAGPSSEAVRLTDPVGTPIEVEREGTPGGRSTPPAPRASAPPSRLTIGAAGGPEGSRATPGPELFASPLVATDDEARRFLNSPGAPAPDPGAAPATEATLIDAKVGDINGRPIYADEFFEPLEAYFVAERARRTRESWLAMVRNEITSRVRGIVTDELLRAEALQRLTPEQQQGLRAFLEQSRQNFIGENRGSVERAEQQARLERGKSLNQLLQEEKESVLIGIEIRESINRRVNVSWRDIRQRYLRDYSEYNRDPVATFRVIRVPASDAEGVREVTDRLAAGEAFEEIASGEPNGYNPDRGGLETFSFSGDFEDASFFSAGLNDAATSLQIGETVGPVELGTLVFWVRLESIVGRSVSLYDAQLAIENELLEERRREELKRYIDRLVERARVNNANEIAERLYEIAVDRYGPSEG
ncbi:MAG: hypothetical protein ACF8Q5_06665 [Phycisphaerales bacterium JB040]